MVSQSDSVLSRDHTNAIGSLVVVASNLESLLTDLIGVFLKTDIRNVIVTVHHQQFASKADNLLALCNLAFEQDPTFAPILDMVKQAKEIGDYRNTMVHAYWEVDNDGIASAIRFSSRGKLRRTRTPYSAQEIQARADEGAELVRSLARLRDRFLENT